MTETEVQKLDESVCLLTKVVDRVQCNSCGGSLAESPIKGCDSAFHCGSAQIVRDSKATISG